jgi:hypothetical protein
VGEKERDRMDTAGGLAEVGWKAFDLCSDLNKMKKKNSFKCVLSSRYCSDCWGHHREQVNRNWSQPCKRDSYSGGYGCYQDWEQSYCSILVADLQKWPQTILCLLQAHYEVELFPSL